MLAYENNTYNISFNKNNSNATGTMPTFNNIKYSETIKLPKNSFAVKKSGVRSKQIFVGWNTRADGSGRSLLDEESVSRLTKTNKGNLVLFAQWEDADYEISKPITYAIDLAEAVQIAEVNSTIKCISDFAYGDISPKITKNLKIDFRDSEIHMSEPILISNGAVVTVIGSGFVFNDFSPLFTLTDGSKLIKKGTADWGSWSGNIIHATNSSFELYGGHLNTNSRRAIYGCNIGDSLIKDTTVHTSSYTDYVIRVTGSGNLTINGRSKVGNGIYCEPYYGTEPVSVIGWASTGKLTLDDYATVYENGMGSCGIVVGANSELMCLGNSSIYVNMDLERLKNVGAREYGYETDNVNPKGFCISLDSSSKLTLNSAGDFFTLSETAIAFKTDSNGKSGTFTYTKGKLATRYNKYTVWRYNKHTKHFHPDSLNNGNPVQERVYILDASDYNDNIKSHVWNLYEYQK